MGKLDSVLNSMKKISLKSIFGFGKKKPIAIPTQSSTAGVAQDIYIGIVRVCAQPGSCDNELFDGEIGSFHLSVTTLSDGTYHVFCPKFPHFDGDYPTLDLLGLRLNKDDFFRHSYRNCSSCPEPIDVCVFPFDAVFKNCRTWHGRTTEFSAHCSKCGIHEDLCIARPEEIP